MVIHQTLASLEGGAGYAFHFLWLIIYVEQCSRNSCYTAQPVLAAVTRPFLLQAKGVAMPDYYN